MSEEAEYHHFRGGNLSRGSPMLQPIDPFSATIYFYKDYLVPRMDNREIVSLAFSAEGSHALGSRNFEQSVISLSRSCDASLKIRILEFSKMRIFWNSSISASAGYS